MKHKNPSSVFQLIKSMDRGEKRFFNLYCSRQDNKVEKNYIKLFKYIDKQKDYNEYSIKKEFRNYGAQFNLAKSYLYKLVLDSLAQYYAQTHLSSYDQLLKIKVLYEKGLYKQSQKMIYKVRNLAEGQNNFIIAIETINLERSLLLKSGRLTEENITILQKQSEQYIDFIEEIELYKHLYDKIVFFDFKYAKMYQDDIIKTKFNVIASSDLFKNTTKPHAIMSKWLLFCTRGLYYKILDDYENSFKEYFAAIKILDLNPEFKKNYPNSVAQALKGYIMACIAVRKLDLALQKLSELKTFCSSYSTTDTRMALLSCQTRVFDIYIHTDQKKEAMQLVDEIEEKIKNGELVGDSNKLVFYSNTIITCTQFAEHQKSLYWVNKILNYEFAEKNFPNMYSAARLIQLINLTELGDYDLLFYKMKSLHRFLGKQNSIYLYQQIYMDFVRRILKGEFNKSNILMLYKEVREALITAFKDPKEAKACPYFDFVGWFESKIEKMPYTTWLKMNQEKNKMAV